jgi:hypothetical protein
VRAKSIHRRKHDDKKKGTGMNVVRSILSAALGLSGFFLAMSAEAGSFTPPPNCETYLTVQSRQCSVSNHYRCAADAPGDSWRVDFDQEGRFFEAKTDRETQWIESREFNPSNVQTLDPNPADPASFSTLLASGFDSFDFNLSHSNGEHSHVTGSDRLTGESVVIDDVELQETEFEYTETDMSGNILRQGRGHEYIHPGWRKFFSGPSEIYAGDDTWLPMDSSPKLFINPGEPGFGATQPLFDCDPVLSSLPHRPASPPWQRG